jgi:predicted enzyme related to lactoylglutathione lyase
MTIELGSITLVAENMTAMLRFYNSVFDASFQPAEILGGHQTYTGTIAGIRTVLCPNALVEIDAKRNRHQLHFVVSDIHALMAEALANGGSVLEEIREVHGKQMGAVYDPDQNSMVFIQA